MKGDIVKKKGQVYKKRSVSPSTGREGVTSQVHQNQDEEASKSTKPGRGRKKEFEEKDGALSKKVKI